MHAQRQITRVFIEHFLSSKLTVTNRKKKLEKGRSHGILKHCRGTRFMEYVIPDQSHKAV